MTTAPRDHGTSSKRFGTVDVLKNIDLDAREGRLPGAGRPVGLRQVDAAQHSSPASEPVSAGDIRIDGRLVNGLHPSKTRHRHGVPVLRALSQHDGGREHRLRHGDARRAEGRSATTAVADGRQDAADRAICSTAGRASSPAASASASPWAAPWCASPSVFLFDEPLSQPRRQAPRRDADRDQAPASADRRPPSSM